MKNIIKLFLFIIIGCSKSNRNTEHVDYIEQTILTKTGMILLNIEMVISR